MYQYDGLVFACLPTFNWKEEGLHAFMLGICNVRLI